MNDNEVELTIKDVDVETKFKVPQVMDIATAQGFIMRFSDIIKAFQKCSTMVVPMVQKYKKTRRNTSWGVNTKKEFVKYRDTHSTKETAEHYNLSTTTVANYYKLWSMDVSAPTTEYVKKSNKIKKSKTQSTSKFKAKFKLSSLTQKEKREFLKFYDTYEVGEVIKEYNMANKQHAYDTAYYLRKQFKR